MNKKKISLVSIALCLCLLFSMLGTEVMAAYAEATALETAHADADADGKDGLSGNAGSLSALDENSSDIYDGVTPDGGDPAVGMPQEPDADVDTPDDPQDGTDADADMPDDPQDGTDAPDADTPDDPADPDADVPEVIEPNQPESPDDEKAEEETPVQPEAPVFGDINGDGAVDLNDLRELLARGHSLTEARTMMPLELLGGDISGSRFKVELWSDNAGTRIQELSVKELAERTGARWAGVPSGPQRDDDGLMTENYPAVPGYSIASVRYRDVNVKALGVLRVQAEDGSAHEGVYAITEGGGTHILSGAEIVIRYVAQDVLFDETVTPQEGGEEAAEPEAPEIGDGDAVEPKAPDEEDEEFVPELPKLEGTEFEVPVLPGEMDEEFVPELPQEPGEGDEEFMPEEDEETIPEEDEEFIPEGDGERNEQMVTTLLDVLDPNRKIDISLSWVGEMAFGKEATLHAALQGYEEAEYALQWETSKDDVTWSAIEGATGTSCDVTVTEDNYQNYWRVQVTVTGVREQ